MSRKAATFGELLAGLAVFAAMLALPCDATRVLAKTGGPGKELHPEDLAASILSFADKDHKRPATNFAVGQTVFVRGEFRPKPGAKLSYVTIQIFDGKKVIHNAASMKPISTGSTFQFAGKLRGPLKPGKYFLEARHGGERVVKRSLRVR